MSDPRFTVVWEGDPIPDWVREQIESAPSLTRDDLQSLVEQQANDPGLWFNARTAPEAYLQQELRKLHAAIEARQSLTREEGMRLLDAYAAAIIRFNAGMITPEVLFAATEACLKQMGVKS